MALPLDHRWHHDARWRLVVSVLTGAIGGGLISFALGPVQAVLLGWAITAASYCLITWLSVGRMTPEQTASHATREAPRLMNIHILLVCAAVASLAGIIVLITHPSGSRNLDAAVTLLVVLASWAVIHTLHALRYARQYYSSGGGIDFHGDDSPSDDGSPAYVDFAYLAFTIGMSFAVSDPDLTSRDMRRIALGHSLLAYLFGTVFVAALVNILASLGV
ncbi:MAG: DUF1345 domain-containing protein [Propionibacteriaceae bacterium]|jgi:uncharacterized membrane protein|nr:DUF1345 domain-containing protein [Propionibacteriaceae bacterium]